MKVVLINPYELGRQSFGLAHPAAWLERAGCRVTCCDLSIQKIDENLLQGADLVALHVPMHTATRIAIEALPRIRGYAPQARLCVYGLYAPMNAALFRSLGVETILGGEYEPGLALLAQQIASGEDSGQQGPEVSLEKIAYITPDRSGLAALENYAKLIQPNGQQHTVGFADTTRGCKYLCRHCPVVPVYNGTFRVIPADVVMQDIRNQVAAGAEHISFGDPDFFNGPGHALRIVRALHEEFPDISYDATIKIEHIVKYPEEIKILKETGCLFILSAVESVDDEILRILDKGHTRADFIAALEFLRDTGVHLAPTFVPFNPWTSIEGYLELLRHIAELELVESVAPVQLSIRLLIPEGSYLLKLDSLPGQAGGFDPDSLGYTWKNLDPRVDRLQQDVQAWVVQAENSDCTRVEIFQGIWNRAHQAAGIAAPKLPAACAGEVIPRLSENWYCCAEPTSQQLSSF